MPRILIVDDDPNLRGLIRMMLEAPGVEIEEASDGQDAVRRFRARPADLIVCDLFMPEKDGLAVIRELSGAKVVAMSGGGFGGAMDMLPTARHFGAAAVLYKPFKKTDLLKVIQEILPTFPV
jgi:CheY-like chemotaxis protein